MIGVVVVLRNAADIYDMIAVHMTTKWYKAVLNRIDRDSNILDVGIGTATALLNNIDIVKSKNLNIIGIDYDSKYIDKAKQSITKNGSNNNINVYCKSIYDVDDIRKTLEKDGNLKPFNVAYFSGSFTLLPDPIEALNSCVRFMNCDNNDNKNIINNRIYITAHCCLYPI